MYEWTLVSAGRDAVTHIAGVNYEYDGLTVLPKFISILSNPAALAAWERDVQAAFDGVGVGTGLSAPGTRPFRLKPYRPRQQLMAQIKELWPRDDWDTVDEDWKGVCHKQVHVHRRLLAGESPAILVAPLLAYTLYQDHLLKDCLLYTSPSPRDATLSRMPSSA